MTDASVVAAYLVVAAHPDDFRVASEVHALLERLARTVAGKLEDRLMERLRDDAYGDDPFDAIRLAVEAAVEGDAGFDLELSNLCTELDCMEGEHLVAEVRRRRDSKSTPNRSDPPVRPGEEQHRTCPRCGAPVQKGEAFCRSCGAYLEWDAAPPQEVPSPVQPAAQGSGGGPITPPTASTKATTGHDSTATTPSTSAIPRVATPKSRSKKATKAAPGQLACPACGHINPLSRTLCARCGETLRPKDTEPRPSVSSAVQDQIDRAVQEVVKEGRVLFNAAERMRQGRAKRVDVAISRTRGLDEQLLKMTRGSGSPHIEDVETSPFMAVELKGAAFEIMPLQVAADGEQLLREVALWQFDVLPKHGGDHQLQVCLAMRIPLQGRRDERVSVPVLERSIRVTVDPRYSANHFLRENWKWCVASLAGLGGAIAAWLQLFQGGS